MAHKTVGDLKPKDQFLMAGGHYEILDVYETDDVDRVKIAFMPVSGAALGRFQLTIDTSVLFVTL